MSSPLDDLTPSQLTRFAAQANAATADPKGFAEMASEFDDLVAKELFEGYLRHFDAALGLPPSTDAEYVADAAKMRADVEREQELLKLPPLEQVRARGCDAPDPGIYSWPDGSYACRCMTCGRCGHHTGNNTQGHYWRLCKATGLDREFHFCCPDDCSLEAGKVAADA